MSELTSKPDEDDGAGEPPSDDVLAGEYVLGVLDGAQRRIVEARIETDPIFARLIVEWEQRLGPMAEGVEPAEVPDYVWSKTRERLGWQADLPSRVGLWRSLGFWRAATAVAVVVAIAVAVLRIPPVFAPNPLVSQPVAARVTTLASVNGTPGWLASIDTQRGAVLLVPVPSAPDRSGRVPELWLIPSGQAPRPLGLLSNQRTSTLIVPADLRGALASGGAVLAISLEPPGGAPHGAPTGPIIAKGMIQL